MIVKVGLWAVLLVVVGVWPQGQDPPPLPRPPAPPADAAPLPPVVEPWVEHVPRADLPERFSLRDPLEGVWQLRARTVDGVPGLVGPGYMSIGRRHLLVQFQAPGPDPEVALLRAGAYQWQRAGDGDMVRTIVLAGHFNDASGDVYFEPTGAAELRRFELLDSALRVHQPGGDWLEFVRVE